MGYVRTNAPVKFGGGGGGGGSGTQDLPTHPSSISANGGNQHVTLTLEYSSTDLVDGVQINYKLDGYPTSPTDGESVTEMGAATEIKIEGLTNSLTYYFRVFLYNEVGGAKYYQTDIVNAQVTCIPRAVEITGINPLVSATDHIVIVESCAGTISLPQGTKIILGSGGEKGGQGGKGSGFKGGSGGHSGYIQQITVSSDIESQSFTATISASRVANGTSITIGQLSYDCGDDSNDTIIPSKWGPIGGKGGQGESSGTFAENGFDACGGGGSGSEAHIGKGGNIDGYGNHGANGTAHTGMSVTTYYCGNGGKGGYAAGGGGGSGGLSNQYVAGSGGAGGTGIIVIQWD